MNRLNSMRPSGFTLIELMVALTLGLLLALILGQIFIGNRQTYLAQEQYARVQENGRYAIDLLGKIIRQAGYKNNYTADAASVFPTGGTDAIIGTEGGAAVPPASLPSDTLTVRFQGSGTPADNTIFGCAGDAIAAGTMAANTFSISGTTLQCTDAAGVAKDVIDGVESMQIVYGEDTDGDATANIYRKASVVANWSQVVSVRLGLVLRTERAIRTDDDTNSYDLPGGDLFDPVDDRLLRRVFTTTITLRNRVP